MKTMKDYYVYIMCNKANKVLYTGVTSNLYNRVLQHKNGQGGLFTLKYKIQKLVYYEVYAYITDAIAREKQIKAGSRRKKFGLINEINPEWKDLFEDLQF